VLDGLRLAVTTLTVLPVRPGRVDRGSAAVAMSLAPLVGALLGLVLAGLCAGLRELLPPLLAGAVTVAAAVLLTRGLHLDGLADTVDALGSYRSGEAALEVMRKPDIGPFGVAAIVLTLVIQVVAVSPWAAVLAWTTGRLGITAACRRGVPAARPEGLGALVAGTVPAPVVAGLAIAVGAGAVWAVPGRPWHGPAAVAGAMLVVLLLLRHAVRRFGGVTGDVLGAVAETGTTVTLVLLALR
jgi:adenosylcobinamide-GDP ribazoletransferase